MRPFGHTQAKRERRADVASIDTHLQRAWERYARECFSVGFDDAFHYALELLAPLSFSQTTLEQQFLRTIILHGAQSATGRDSPENIGIFLSAGYALLPQERIVYALETPAIANIGFGLEKDIIITGTTGDFAGHNLHGRLEIHGVVGWLGGADMIGTLVNYGSMDHRAGYSMIGVMENHGSLGPESGLGMIGKYTDGRRGRWLNFSGDKERFLQDIAHPPLGDFTACSRVLRGRYKRRT
jgi:hypothetical protein